MLRGAQPTIFGDGEQSRDFTYIDHAVEANLLACKVPQPRQPGRSSTSPRAAESPLMKPSRRCRV